MRLHPAEAGRETMLSFLEVKLDILTSPPMGKLPQRNTAKAHHFSLGIYQMGFSSSQKKKQKQKNNCIQR